MDQHQYDPARTYKKGERIKAQNGIVLEFDGEDWVTPSSQAASPPQENLASTLTNDALLPTVGAFIGGKTPLGPLGSAVGAMAGKGIGDINQWHNTNPGDFLNEIIQDPQIMERLKGFGEGALEGIQDTAMVGGGTFAAEKLLPFLKHVPSIKWRDILRLGGPSLGIGAIMGHAGTGGAVGAGLGAYNLGAKTLQGVGKAAEFMGTPQGGQAIKAASQDVAQYLGPKVVASPGGQKIITKATQDAQQLYGGTLGNLPVPREEDVYKRVLEAFLSIFK